MQSYKNIEGVQRYGLQWIQLAQRAACPNHAQVSGIFYKMSRKGGWKVCCRLIKILRSCLPPSCPSELSLVPQISWKGCGGVIRCRVN